MIGTALLAVVLLAVQEGLPIPTEGYDRSLRGLRAVAVDITADLRPEAAKLIERAMVNAMKDRGIEVLPAASVDVPSILSVSLVTSQQSHGVAYAVTLDLLELVPVPRSPQFSTYAATWTKVEPGWVSTPAEVESAAVNNLRTALDVFRSLHQRANERR